MAQGALFSYPYLRTGLGVLIAADTTTTEYDKWAFLRPFSSGVWIAVVCTAVMIPIFLFLIENLTQTGRLPVGMSLLSEWRHASYSMFLTCFNLQVLEVLSYQSQLLIVVFAFSNLILIASYTANLAAVLTSSATRTGLNTLADLRGLPVLAHGPYMDDLAKNYQVKAKLQAGTISAYIEDRPVMQWYLKNQNADCSLSMTQDTNVGPFDYAMAFHRLSPPSLLDEFNVGVVAAQAANYLNILESRYLGVLGGGSCGAAGGYSASLQFSQVAGLWIIMGSVAGFGLLGAAYGVWYHHVHRGEGDLSIKTPMTSLKRLSKRVVSLHSNSVHDISNTMRPRSFAGTAFTEGFSGHGQPTSLRSATSVPLDVPESSTGPSVRDGARGQADVTMNATRSDLCLKAPVGEASVSAWPVKGDNHPAPPCPGVMQTRVEAMQSKLKAPSAQPVAQPRPLATSPLAAKPSSPFAPSPAAQALPRQGSGSVGSSGFPCSTSPKPPSQPPALVMSDAD
ncbi:hypothetical protein V8C86DRAFT_3166329 [Haematococcus lacustris]